MYTISKYLNLNKDLNGSLRLIEFISLTPTFANSVDPDQMASESSEAIRSGSTLFVMQFVN